MKHILAAVLLSLLCACGGGDVDDDDQATPGPVDCKATPERCV